MKPNASRNGKLELRKETLRSLREMPTRIQAIETPQLKRIVGGLTDGLVCGVILASIVETIFKSFEGECHAPSAVPSACLTHCEDQCKTRWKDGITTCGPRQQQGPLAF